MAGHAHGLGGRGLADPHDVHGQVAETTPQPATEQAVQAWHRAASH
ncbi:hypothetical protein ABII15_38150 [Streptomyces sp. HUAS MG91]|uniref:Uncharacterized protein n=1 Tax=Streptomyces tabacisoli TaxID=3156398 RepID=A0AAU8J3C1_9ACTN